jgi:hypothetical protein
MAGYQESQDWLLHPEKISLNEWNPFVLSPVEA